MIPYITSEHLEKILEHISDGIQIVDDKGFLVFCNRHSAMLDDIQLSESIGKHITEIYPSLKSETSTLLDVLKTGLPILNKEQSYRNYKGKVIATINSTMPLIEGGRVKGAIEISRNITPYKELSERYLALQSSLHGEGVSETTQKGTATYQFEDIITQHAEFNRIKLVAMKAARTDIPVLIYGETGTGKELLTQAIHNHSQRKAKPFIAQNCAALPGSLLEGILFGTVKGGFTGAVDRPGLFELADTGTLFLDEINSMPLELQAKLLRVLQDGKIRRVGDIKERVVDVRIIAATNIEPNHAIETGLIRRDLYYRLNTVSLWIPKLADRREDIPLLTAYFLNKYNHMLYRHIKGISPEVSRIFHTYHWEGNVRELEHVIESAVNFAEGPLILWEDLPTNLKRFEPKERVETTLEGQGLQDVLNHVERQTILQAFEQCGKNVTKTAEALHIPRQTLQYKLKKYQLT